MIRIIGFIVGSVVSVGALLMLVGKPEFRFGSTAADTARYDVAIQQLREKQPVPALPDATPEAIVAADQPDSDDAPTNLAPPLANQQAGSEQPNRELATELEANADHSVSYADDAGPGAVAEPDWYTFWNPFRSEVAAAGFVRRLESVTGLDYRIDKVRAGVYEVAFAYGNDTELETKLAHISAATGLDLTDRP